LNDNTESVQVVGAPQRTNIPFCRVNKKGIPRTKKGGYDWEALPPGRYFIEWYERGKRKREAGGGTAAEALEVARRRKHVIEGRALGLAGEEVEETKRTAVHAAVKHYLDSVEALKNTLKRKGLHETLAIGSPPSTTKKASVCLPEYDGRIDRVYWATR